jgi:hypothetical protein
MTALMRSRSSALFLSWLFSSWLPACVADHDQLAEHPGAGGADAGGGGRGVIHEDASAEASRESGTEPEPSADTGAPAGTLSLTFLHGVIDSPWIAFCASAVHDGRTAAPGKPFPVGGLGYGNSVTLDAVPGVDVAHDGVAPYVVAAASADAVKGLDCAQIFGLAAQLALPVVPDAGPSPESAPPVHIPDGSVPPRTDAATGRDASPSGARDAARDTGADGAIADTAPPPVPIAAVRVAALPVIPAGAFSLPRGYLVVAGGCLGGPGVTDPSEQSVCGEGYTPTAPTLTELVVAPSAEGRDARVALQVLGATPAITQLDLGLVPASQGDAVTVATRVVPGALRPTTPYTRVSAAEIGATSDTAAVELFAFGSSVPAYKKPWAPTLEAGKLDGLLDGAAYTLVVIGPFPGFAKRQWWNDPLVTMVQNRR